MKNKKIINIGVKMRRLLLFAAGITLLMMTVFPVEQLKAQVFGEFEGVTVVNRPFEHLQGAVAIDPSQFVLPPNNTPDLDDGYAEIPLDKFAFEFNGEVYTKIWINVNGFITFGRKTINGTLMPPPNLTAGTKNPNALFWDDPSFPVNVIAPFWGDHHYRPDSVKFKGYAPTVISYKSEADKFTIEWKDLNINYFPDFKASVADFQLILYKSTDPYSAQGNVEFRYGTVGKRPYQEQYWKPNEPGFDERVFVNNCAVGLKGEGKGFLQKADFMNALYNGGRIPFSEIAVVTETTLTTEWTPSGSNAKSIYMTAKVRFNVEEWWGDGDVDFSKTAGQPHFNKPQNRFVTINDARLIMRSIATNVRLDSIRRRAAYHADVNHNGRFYYDTNGVRKNIPWRTMNYADSIQRITDISSLKQIMFQANEADAAMIIAYISGRVPTLPWILDTFPQYGKVNESVASLKFGEFTRVNSNTFKMPVYLDAMHNGPVGAKFNLDANVVSVSANETENNTLIAMNEFGMPVVVLSGSGEFDASKPIAYVTFTSDKDEVTISNIRYNDAEVENVRMKLNVSNNEDVVLMNTPNPVVSSTNFTVNINNNASYILAVYDMQGNVVRNIHNGMLAQGAHSFDWNVTDEAGNKVDNGVYFYRLTGNGETITKKLVVSK